MIDRIFHVSDIHIRTLKRHKEYEEVFENLYKVIREKLTDNSLIFLGGDIVHSKTDISPELVRVTTRFFNRLLEFCPVLLIPGNHDANLSNSDRLDSLTPIVESINNPRLMYFKHTGLHHYNGIDFYHYSVFDNTGIIPTIENKHNFNICLYHGPVGEMEHVHVKFRPEDFEGFDLVLLGDIHIPNNFSAPNIAQPGSLCQQNHGESYGDHGILIWDIPSKEHQFVVIDNSYGYKTITIENSVIKELPKLNKNTRVRFEVIDTPKEESDRLITEIKNNYSINEYSTVRINKNALVTYGNNKNLLVNSLKDIEYQESIFRRFISSDDIDSVLEINSKLNSLLKFDRTTSTRWSPKKFEFSNLFSYGENNVVDFSNMTGLYGIFAGNTFGKSGFLESVCYCLFDRTPKTSKTNHIININSDYFYCRLDFELDGLLYTIERKGERKKNDSNSIKVDVNFYYVNEHGDEISLKGKERSDTNNIIRQYIGTFEDFILTTFSNQGTTGNFISKGQTEKKEIFVQFLELGIFDSLYELAKVEQDKLKIQLDILNNQYTDKLKHLPDIDEELINSKIKDVEKVIEELINKSNILENELTQLNSSLIPLINLREFDKTKLVNKLATIRYKRGELNDRVLYLKTKINDCRVTETTIHTELNSYLHVTNPSREYLAKLETLNSEVLSLQYSIKNMESHVYDMKNHKYDPNCVYCTNSSIVYNGQTAIKELPISLNKLEELSKNQQQLSDWYKDAKYKEQLISKLQSNEQEISKLELSLKGVSFDLERLDVDETDINEQISDIDNQQFNIEHNNSVNLSIVRKRAEYSETIETVMEYKLFLSDCFGRLKDIQKRREEIKDILYSIKEYESQLSKYNTYLLAVSKGGIPYQFMKLLLPSVENEVNNILEGVFDFRVVFHGDDKNINTYIYYDDGRYWPLELSSGMENFFAALAIRVALINICNLPRPNFIAIDEGFGVTDSNNLSDVPIFFEKLKTFFDFVLIVSHIDIMRDMVDNNITITKEAGISKIYHM